MGMIGVYVAGMLFFGSLNTITTKVMFSMKAEGLTGEELFRKPWFGTFNMFVGMTLALAAKKCFRLCCLRSRSGLIVPDDGHQRLLDDDEKDPDYLRKVLLVSIPSFFDLLATGLCSVGMLYIPASVWQMLRGCEIVFAAMLAITCLKRRMLGFNWLGLFLCVVGVTFVSLANIWGGVQPGESSDSSKMILGMAMVVLGQVVQAAQVIAEEWLLTDVDLPEIEIVGYEGMWGVLMMLLVVYPILWLMPGDDHGHQEDPLDCFAMLGNSRGLLAMVCINIFSCGTYNVTGIAVTGALSAVHRTMLEASRTSIIWVFGLVIHYHVNSHWLFGEVWTPYSWLQLVGFIVLMLGQSIYGEILKVPGLYYPRNLSASTFASPGAMKLASPLPRAVE